MEDISKTYLTLTKVQKKARVNFSVKYVSFDWSLAVFVGLKKVDDIEMLGVVSQFDGCAFHVVTTGLTTHKYVSFLDDVILPMWKLNKNLVFVHVRKDKSIT